MAQEKNYMNAVMCLRGSSKFVGVGSVSLCVSFRLMFQVKEATGNLV